ncbi:ABC transporter permease [Sediminispirochaeta bajacaliforniensis]|uniref:ABC transporter permease n=1 Tax=Sediminispirochaeta bajacaliforniensis TaxID=148 RepID=UPI0003674170|nr:proline/glycine betaine ABC transporter permease [Sediminispirochaeta bajacaliforniensis]
MILETLRDILDVGGWFETIIDWMTLHWDGFFDGVSAIVQAVLSAFLAVFSFPPPIVLVLLLAVLAWLLVSRGAGILSFIGFSLIWIMGLWGETMETLSLVVTSVILALLIAVPVGIWSSKKDTVQRIVRPVLDFMQTLPAFVYLIPAVLFFKLGPVPGVVATLIFAMPPSVRLTNLGIRQVPKEIKEAAKSFGATSHQMLLKAELPVALPTILAGVNQTIMLALSMVVIAGMIGAGGLGNEVLKGITQLKIDQGFEGGIAIVILAMYLDRVTQALGKVAGTRRR